MKTNYQLAVPLFLLMFSLTTTSYGQSTYTVTLHVDVEILNQGNPSKACSFSSDAEVIDNSSPENFTIRVEEDDEIIWVAFTSDNQPLDIETIEFMNNGPFGNPRLNGETNGRQSKKAKGRVLPNTRGKEFKYSVAFSFDEDLFVIDPKIKIGR